MQLVKKSFKREWQYTALMMVFVLFFCENTNAQSEFELEFNLQGGSEYNIFKSPDELIDKSSGNALPKDSLIFSDLYYDMGYDVEYKFRNKKNRIRLGSDFWYRDYLDYTDLSQGRFSAFAIYQKKLSSKIWIGGQYKFRWSNRIGTSVTGDLLMRSFKYYANSGRLFLDYKASKKVEMSALIDYDYKTYYDEQFVDPLDHADLELEYDLNYEFIKDNELNIQLSWRDRNYFEYHSIDSAGKYIDTYPLRNFKYYAAKIDYNWTAVKRLRINPGIKVKRRVDAFQDYFSYWSYGADIRLRYYWSDFYLSLYASYNQMEYDIREAFSSLEQNPKLVYDYYDVKLLFRYDVNDQWRLYIESVLDTRDSNSDLESFKTRRPYQNFTSLIGVQYTLPSK